MVVHDMQIEGLTKNIILNGNIIKVGSFKVFILHSI